MLDEQEHIKEMWAYRFAIGNARWARGAHQRNVSLHIRQGSIMQAKGQDNSATWLQSIVSPNP
jgi:hypothetical protein